MRFLQFVRKLLVLCFPQCSAALLGRLTAASLQKGTPHCICRSTPSVAVPQSHTQFVFDVGWVAAIILNVTLILSYISMYNVNNNLIYVFIQLMEAIV